MYHRLQLGYLYSPQLLFTIPILQVPSPYPAWSSIRNGNKETVKAEDPHHYELPTYMDTRKYVKTEDDSLEIHGPSNNPKPTFYDNNYPFEEGSDADIEWLDDSVCAQCDDGGAVLIFAGRCMRCFHPTVHSGVEACCESLGILDLKKESEYHAIPTFFCDNCKYEQHQCIVCGLLGSSNKSSSAEVFCCIKATCGRFYHPQCAANTLFPSEKSLATQFTRHIASGEPFLCPVHKCHACQGYEKRDDFDLQFALCRRCPKAYHRKCLPNSIGFTGNASGSAQQRAWDNLLPKRVLMYCTDHLIIVALQTPKRDHLLFPCMEPNRYNDVSGMGLITHRRSNGCDSCRI